VAGLSVPPQRYGEWLWPFTQSYIGGYPLKIDNAPPVYYRANITLSTVGEFSANNFINMRAAVYDANITNLRAYYEAIAFGNAGYPIASASPLSVSIPLLNQTGPGVWKAIGRFEFTDSVNVTGPILIPINFTEGAKGINYPALLTPEVSAQVASYHFPLTVAPQSETNTILTNEYTVKYTVAFLSLSFLGLQFPLEAILIPERQRKKSEKRKSGPDEVKRISEDYGEPYQRNANE
jgi:hypothetical protein